jgi:hypothetical protein
MFADDTHIDTSGNYINTVTNTLNNDLKNVSDRLTVNKLSLNTKKTEYMIIGSYQRLNLIETDPPIYLGTEKNQTS